MHPAEDSFPCKKEGAPFLISAHCLAETGQQKIQTPIKSLNPFLEKLNWAGAVVEWGVPQGSISRLLPAVLAKALNKDCLWVSDQEQPQVYPSSWAGIGFDLNNIHFLKENEPLASIRNVIHENTFKLLVIDTKQRLTPADFHFFSRSARQNQSCFFLFRHFFLSQKKGNPFCRYRFNSSYSIQRQAFSLSLLKGGKNRRLNLSFKEVLCG